MIKYHIISCNIPSIEGSLATYPRGFDRSLLCYVVAQ